MSETLSCKQCPSDMRVEMVNGKKRWVCADCGYSMPYREASLIQAFRPWMAAVVIVAGIFLYTLFQ